MDKMGNRNNAVTTFLQKIKNPWFLLAAVFINIPVSIAVLSIVMVVVRDPEFVTELFTEILTRENVVKFNDMQSKVDYLWVEAGGDMN